VPGCQKLQMTVSHRMLYSCTHMATVGVKGLNLLCIVDVIVRLQSPETSLTRLLSLLPNCSGGLTSCTVDAGRTVAVTSQPLVTVTTQFPLVGRLVTADHCEVTSAAVVSHPAANRSVQSSTPDRCIDHITITTQTRLHTVCVCSSLCLYYVTIT